MVTVPLTTWLSQLYKSAVSVNGKWDIAFLKRNEFDWKIALLSSTSKFILNENHSPLSLYWIYAVF